MLNCELSLKKCEVITMMKSKKGADLSMNVIIIAAIALLVLVILAVLLFRSGNQVTEGTKCQALNGQCGSIQTPPDQVNNYIKNPAVSGCGTGQVCWVKLGKIS